MNSFLMFPQPPYVSKATQSIFKNPPLVRVDRLRLGLGSAGLQPQGVVGQGGQGGGLRQSHQPPSQARADLPGGLPGELQGVDEGEVVALLLVGNTLNLQRD